MSKPLDSVTLKQLGMEPKQADKSQANPQHIQKKPKLIIHTTPREVRSPTPEPPTTRSHCNPAVCSLESPTIDSRPSGASLASQTTPKPKPRLLDFRGKPQETRESMFPTDEMATLKSPTPSPSKVPGPTSNNGPSPNIDNEDLDMLSNRSSTGTLPPNSEFVRPTSEVSLSWPVDSRAGLDEVYKGSARAYERASPLLIRPVLQPKPMPQFPSPLFCCTDLKKHLRTSPIMPTELKKIHGPVIDSFLTSIGPALETPTILPQDVFNNIKRIVKVNRVLSGSEVTTHLFTTVDNESFTKLVDLPQVLLFNPQGEGSYQSYSCGKHRTMYRVGVYDKKFRSVTKKWSFGDKGLDFAMGLVSEAEMALDRCKAVLSTY